MYASSTYVCLDIFPKVWYPQLDLILCLRPNQWFIQSSKYKIIQHKNWPLQHISIKPTVTGTYSNLIFLHWTQILPFLLYLNTCANVFQTLWLYLLPPSPLEAPGKNISFKVLPYHHKPVPLSSRFFCPGKELCLTFLSMPLILLCKVILQLPTFHWDTPSLSNLSYPSIPGNILVNLICYFSLCCHMFSMVYTMPQAQSLAMFCTAATGHLNSLYPCSSWFCTL